LRLPSRTVYFFFGAFWAAFFAGFFFAVAMFHLQVGLRPLMRPLRNVDGWRALDQRNCRRKATPGVRALARARPSNPVREPGGILRGMPSMPARPIVGEAP
jgi:hypothetical protein